jgi:EAL domain-containing protein (putative c-di-GMP-specific phosphodiesterase class I)
LFSFSTEKNGMGMPLEYRVQQRSIDRTSAELTGWSNPLERLREALQKDEFALYGQPVLELSSKDRFPLAELLVRMREEERALLPPGEFLPVFEHYGMMPQLDRWVLRHGVRQLARGSRIPRFAINVSAQTLQDTEFPGFAAAELREAGLPMNAVLFEIDETDVLAQLGSAAAFAAAVKAYGGGVSIDGFCRRAVSFAPFTALRPDFVKVDGSVTRNLLTSPAAQTKLNAVLRVAGSLGIGVVAECVEEEAQLARLKELQVAYGQGFGIAEPQPMESFSARR